MQANYRVTITDSDYNYTTYTTWVSATSKMKAVAKAACLIGGEKTRREWLRMHRDPYPEPLTEPDIEIVAVDMDEYWDNQDKVVVASDQGRRPWA